MSLQSAAVDTLLWVKADLNYLLPTTERPRTYTYEPPAGVPRTTVVNEPHRVQIADARPIVAETSLDEEGSAWRGIVVRSAISMTSTRSSASTTLRPSSS